MAVHVYNISAMLLHSETPEYLIHGTANELHLDGSILKNAKSLLVILNLLNVEIKVLRHAEHQGRETRLAQFCFGISMETILVAQGPLSVEVTFSYILHNTIDNIKLFTEIGGDNVPLQCCD